MAVRFIARRLGDIGLDVGESFEAAFGFPYMKVSFHCIDSVSVLDRVHPRHAHVAEITSVRCIMTVGNKRPKETDPTAYSNNHPMASPSTPAPWVGCLET